MKNHIAILIGALALCSCEDYLTQENPNKIESEYYFTDESSLEIYTNGFIRSFATAIKSFVDGDKNADTHSWDGQAAYFMDNYSADDATNWTTSNWSQLRSINYYLDNMRNAVASDAILDHYEGVGRFFRALFYIDKVQTFGAVPWYDFTIAASDKEAMMKPRDSREYVMDKVLEDLTFASTYCLSDAKFTKADSRAIADWYESYGYGPDMIAEAAAYAGEKKSVKYVNGILRAWYTKGYKTVRDVMAESAMGSSNVQAAAPAVKHNILGGGLRRAPRVPGMPQEGKTQ